MEENTRKKKKEEAIALFSKGYNCSQAVLSAFVNDLPIDRNLAINLASGFGGGARNGELCGAVSGAIMVLGMKAGEKYAEEEIHERKRRTNEVVKEFTDRFRKRQGDIVCKNLLGHDISKADEHDMIVKEGLFTSKCPEYVACAVELVEEMMGEK